MFSGLMPAVSTALACLTARAAEPRRSTPPRLASVRSYLIPTPEAENELERAGLLLGGVKEAPSDLEASHVLYLTTASVSLCHARRV